MRKAWSFIRRSKRRTAIATVIAVLIPAGAAFGFYVAFLTGTAQTTGTLGSTSSAAAATYTVTASGLTGLTPGNSTPYTVSATTALSTTATVGKAPTMTVTTSDPVNCPASWFTTTDAGTVTYPMTVNHTGETIGSGTLKFVDSGTDQSKCAGDTITLTATS